uniref:Uncharacterized protein n=1 Tax=Plectus sambesii TaxID=2011161 RepID=A0A914WQA6_9BILA
MLADDDGDLKLSTRREEEHEGEMPGGWIDGRADTIGGELGKAMAPPSPDPIIVRPTRFLLPREDILTVLTSPPLRKRSAISSKDTQSGSGVVTGRRFDAKNKMARKNAAAACINHRATSGGVDGEKR